jgi:hypothetical protein
MRTDEYMGTGDAYDETRSTLAEKTFLRPIFIENDGGERAFCAASRRTCRPTKMSRSLRWSATFCVRDRKKHSRQKECRSSEKSRGNLLQEAH